MNTSRRYKCRFLSRPHLISIPIHYKAVAMLVKVFLLLLGFNAVTSRRVNFYRKDYVYVEEFDAFYKLHWDAGNWSSAFLTCDNEGAELFYPRAGEEWTVVKKLAEPVYISNETEIFVGIHDQFHLGELLTVDGRTTPSPIFNVEDTAGLDRCVTMDVNTGIMAVSECNSEPETWRPFVCKKVEDVSCPTIDKGYKYFKDTKKCYKRNDNPKTWAQAMETCYMEGGTLVVVSSEVEANVIKNNVIENNYHYAGFKKILMQNQFYTVTGQKIQDSGYNYWNDEDSKQYECGTIIGSSNYNRLYLNALDCDNRLPFVCEMEVR